MKNPIVSLDILAIPGDSLSSAQHDAVITLCNAAYEVDYAQLMQTFVQPTHVLGLLGGILVSHALWITRLLIAGEIQLLCAAYIEAVATHPDWQGRGFATQIMQCVQKCIVAYDIGALSPSDPAWYTRLGWEEWRGPLSIRTSDCNLHTPDEKVMVLRLPRTPVLCLDASLSAEWRPGELW